jgi:hypothetical protein
MTAANPKNEIFFCKDGSPPNSVRVVQIGTKLFNIGESEMQENVGRCSSTLVILHFCAQFSPSTHPTVATQSFFHRPVRLAALIEDITELRKKRKDMRLGHQTWQRVRSSRLISLKTSDSISEDFCGRFPLNEECTK